MKTRPFQPSPRELRSARSHLFVRVESPQLLGELERQCTPTYLASGQGPLVYTIIAGNSIIETIGFPAVIAKFRGSNVRVYRDLSAQHGRQNLRELVGCAARSGASGIILPSLPDHRLKELRECAEVAAGKRRPILNVVATHDTTAMDTVKAAILAGLDGVIVPKPVIRRVAGLGKPVWIGSPLDLAVHDGEMTNQLVTNGVHGVIASGLERCEHPTRRLHAELYSLAAALAPLGKL